MRQALECRAVVIGIDAYGSGIAPLSSAANDARAIAELLQTQHGYSVRCLTDDEATSTSVLAALAEAGATLEEDHGFLLYFAGHGIALGDGSEGPQGFLLAHDAQVTDERTWLSMDVLRAALDALPCRHLLVVLDCCFAGAFRWSSSRDAMLVGHPLYDSQLARFLDGRAWQALTSAAHDQRAADTLPGRRNTRGGMAEGQHSPFAAALIRGLGGAADARRGEFPADGVITATELYQYLFDALQPFGTVSHQTPGLWPLSPSNRGEFIFLNPQQPVRTQPDPPLDDANNPWVGLRAYQASDAALFHGRGRVIDALVERTTVADSGDLLAVVGASGCGKSSVVRAGLLPALRHSSEQGDAPLGRWHVVEAPRLRADPLVQLDEACRALAAAPPATRGLLFFDQFEELYTQCPDPERRARFTAALKALIDSKDAPLVVLTLRSDFEPRLSGCEHLAARVAKGRYLVPGFSTDEMRAVIEAPLRTKAMFFDPPELVERLLDEVAAMPAAMPLLSFALAEMYRQALRRRRQEGSADRALCEVDYDAIGGVIGALHQRATTLYRSADADTQRSIQRVFLRLVAQEGARLTRRRVSREELQFDEAGEQARVDDAVALYVDARLLVVDQEYLEPAHDTLVVAWESLQEWLAGTHTQPLIRALWRASRDWQAGERERGLLWADDPRLTQAASLGGELNRLERAFVRASVRRKSRQRRVLVATTLTVIALLGAAALYAWERAVEAMRQTRIAEAQLERAKLSEGRALLSLAEQQLDAGNAYDAARNAAESIGYHLFGGPELAAFEAPEFVPPGLADHRALSSFDDADDERRPPTTRLLNPLHAEYTQAIRALTRAGLATVRPVAWRELGRARADDRGRLLAGIGVDGKIQVRDFARNQLSRLDIPALPLQLLAFSADGTRLAAAFLVDRGPPQVWLWRAGTHGFADAKVERLALPSDFPPKDELLALQFSPNGSFLSLATPLDLLLWSLSPGTVADESAPAQWLDPGGTQGVALISSMSFAPDGESLLAGGWHHRLTRYSLPRATDEGPIRLRGTALGPTWSKWSENMLRGDFVRAIEPTKDGRRIVIASSDELRLGEAQPGGRVEFADNAVWFHEQELLTMALSESAGLIAVEDGTGVRLLRYPSLRPLAVFIPNTFRPSQIASLQFLGDLDLLLVGGPGEMLLVDVSGLREGFGQLPYAPLPEPLPDAGNQAALRALIASGQLVPSALAFPDSSKRPDGLRWHLDDENSADGVRVYFEAVQGDGEIDERGTLLLSLQPTEPPLIAAGITKFDTRQMRGADRASIELFTLPDHTMVFSHVFDPDIWGIDRMRFSDDGSWLQVRTSDFDGFDTNDHAVPAEPPNLWPYREPAMCQAPINLPPDHPLAGTDLLDCDEEDTSDAP